MAKVRCHARAIARPAHMDTVFIAGRMWPALSAPTSELGQRDPQVRDAADHSRPRLGHNMTVPFVYVCDEFLGNERSNDA